MADADAGGFAHLSDEDEPPPDEPSAGEAEWIDVAWVETEDLEDLDADDEDDDDEDGISFEYEATIAPGEPAMRELLERGEIEVLGLMPWSSNGTYLVQVRRGADHAPAIYKPERGERPLWDFPGALWKREVATYELSSSLGFDLVPTTVARVSAPIGRGSVQAFVPARFAIRSNAHSVRKVVPSSGRSRIVK